MPRVQLKKSLALFMAFIVVISSVGANNIILFASEDLYADEQIASNLTHISHATTTPPAIILPPSIPEVDIENDLIDDYIRVTEGETLYFDGLYITIGGSGTGITAFDSNVSNSTGDFITFSPAEHYVNFSDIEHGSNVQHSHTINIDKNFGHHTTNVHFSVINVHGVRSPSFFLHTFMEHQPSQTLTLSTALGLPVGSYQTTIEFRIVPLLHPTVTEEIHAVTLLFDVVPSANAPYCCTSCDCWADCNLVGCQCNFIPVTNATWHNQLGRPFFQGETLQLEYTIVPSNATIQDVTWFSLDPTIAQVSDTGLLTIGRPGVTTIGLTTKDRGFTITRVIVSRIRDNSGVFVSVAADPLFHWGYRFWFQERGMRQHTFNIPYHLIGFPNRTVVQGDSSPIEFQVRNVSNERQDDVSLVFTGDISNVLEVIYPVSGFWLGPANATQTNPTPLGAIRHAAFNLRADAPYGTFSGYLEFFQNGQLISTGGSSGLGMPLTWTVLPANTPAHNVTVSTVIGGTATATPTTATQGTSISLTATPSYNFIEWQTNPTVSWTGGTAATNPNATFNMPSSDVTVTPVFNPTNYSIDLFQISGGAATASHATAPAGTSITLTAVPAATHTFEGWEISPYVTFTTGYANSQTAIFTMPSGNVIIMPTFTAIPTYTAVAFNGVIANGTDNTTTTTQLTLNFDSNPLGLSVGNISLPSGINALSLQGTGNSRTINISGNWVNGQQITVTLTNPTGYNITPLSQTVTLHRIPTPNPCTCINNACSGNNACATDNCTCTAPNLPNLCTCTNNACGGNNACATDNCTCTAPNLPNPCTCTNNACGGSNACATDNCACTRSGGNGGNDNNDAGSGNDNGGSWQPSIAPPSRPQITIQGNNGGAYTHGRVSNNQVTLTFNGNRINDFINTAIDNTITLYMYELANVTTIVIPITAVRQFANAKLALKIHTPNGVISFNNTALQDLGQQARSTNISILIEDFIGHSLADPLPNVWIEPSSALITELRETMSDYFADVWDYMDITVTPHQANDIDGGFVVADVHFTVGDAERDNKLREFSAPFTIFADLTGFIPSDMNYHRITAVNGGIHVGGGTNSHIFAVDVNATGTILIAYVENLRRLIISPDSCVIIDLAGNALTQTMDVRPIVENGRTLIPIRFIAEALGAEVGWIPATSDSPPGVTLSLEGQTLTFAIGEMLPGMEIPVQIIDGRTMIPLRFVSEFFGAVVSTGPTGNIEIVSDTSNTGRPKNMEQNEILFYKEDELSHETPEPVDDDNEPDTPESKVRRVSASAILSLEELDTFEFKPYSNNHRTSRLVKL